MPGEKIYILPKLPREKAKKLRDEFRAGTDWFSEERFNEHYASADAFPSVAGNKITEEDLLAFREACENAEAESHEEASKNRKQRTSLLETNLDRLVGREILQFAQDFNLEAAFGDPAVWDFLTLVLLPDVVALRFDPKTADPARFVGGNRRHALQRLWRRWQVLGAAVVQENKLTEDDYGQILERSTFAQNPTLARLFARKLLASDHIRLHGESRKALTRNFAKRVEALSGVVVLSSIDKKTLEAAVDDTFQKALKSVRESDS